MPFTTAPPTVEQLLNLVDRAELKGLNNAEATRLRTGLRILAGRYEDTADVVLMDGNDLAKLRQKYSTLRKSEWVWRRRARIAEEQSTSTAPVDSEDRAALQRVTALARRWTHIPAKRQAATAILTTIRNEDTE
ncbi:hypothetical protein ACIA7S_28640 [Streptomyces sp. NPDC051643]|uniref:hypothetical protein n=1 Tax=Streptomyces sp. NPDC051643 TaxID=3365665 RepID=UPI0037B487F9